MDSSSSDSSSSFSTLMIEASSSSSDLGDDIAVVGSTAPNALRDFPHSRQDCVSFPIKNDSKKFCKNCYCFICDIKASECSNWSSHCDARSRELKWEMMRAAFQLTRKCKDANCKESVESIGPYWKAELDLTLPEVVRSTQAHHIIQESYSYIVFLHVSLLQSLSKFYQIGDTRKFYSGRKMAAPSV